MPQQQEPEFKQIKTTKIGKNNPMVYGDLLKENEALKVQVETLDKQHKNKNKRYLKVGALAFLVSLLPCLLLLQQNNLLSVQNHKMDRYYELISTQSKLLEQQLSAVAAENEAATLFNDYELEEVESGKFMLVKKVK